MVRHEAAEALGGIASDGEGEDGDVLAILREWAVKEDAPVVVRESCQVAIDMWEVGTVFQCAHTHTSQCLRTVRELDRPVQPPRQARRTGQVKRHWNGTFGSSSRRRRRHRVIRLTIDRLIHDTIVYYPISRLHAYRPSLILPAYTLSSPPRETHHYLSLLQRLDLVQQVRQALLL